MWTTGYPYRKNETQTIPKNYSTWDFRPKCGSQK